MNQPPQKQFTDSSPPQWRRPPGVSQGTWQYVNQRSIADRYDDFVADTPLCTLDYQIIEQTFRGPPKSQSRWIVDLGCGTGRTSIPLMQQGYDVLAIDLSTAMLDQLVAKANRLRTNPSNGDHQDDMPIGSLCPLRANLVQLECVADGVMDHAVCLFSTLGMIAGNVNRHTMLNHVSRMVRPGGRLVLHVHHVWAALHEPGGVKHLAQTWWNSIRHTSSDFGDRKYPYRGLEAMFMHRFSRRELTRLLASTQWRIDEMHYVGLDGSTVVNSLRAAGGFIVVASNMKQPACRDRHESDMNSVHGFL